MGVPVGGGVDDDLDALAGAVVVFALVVGSAILGAQIDGRLAGRTTGTDLLELASVIA
jgi:hypothetical protein